MKTLFFGVLAFGAICAHAKSLPTCTEQRQASETHIKKSIAKRVGQFYRSARIISINNLHFKYLSINADMTEMTTSYLMELQSPAPLKYGSSKVFAKVYRVDYELDQGNGDGCAIIASDTLEGNLIFTDNSLVK